MVRMSYESLDVAIIIVFDHLKHGIESNMLDEVEDDHDEHGAHLQPGGSWLRLSIDLGDDGNLSRPWLLCIPQSQP